MSDSGDDRGQGTPETSGEHRPGEVVQSASPQSASVLSLSSRARRRAWLAALAALVTVVALGLPGSGCLNPRPEELPSAEDNQPLAPVRETCDDNPLLAGCSLPEQDISGDPIPAPAPAASDPLSGASDNDEPDAPQVDDMGALLPDAGTDPAPGDSGAP